MFDFLYETRDEEQVAFGSHWCGPDRLEAWKDTLCAVYTPEGKTDGHKVEVYITAAPARFYTLKVLPWPDSTGEMRPGYEVRTGSGAHKIAAAMAKEIMRGMVDFHASAETQPTEPT